MRHRAGAVGSGRAGYGRAGRTAVAVLAAACLAIAAVTPLEIRVIAAGLSPAVPASLTMGALKSPWILQPVFDGFSILSPSWLWLVITVALIAVALAFSRGGSQGKCTGTWATLCTDTASAPNPVSGIP